VFFDRGSNDAALISGGFRLLLVTPINSLVIYINRIIIDTLFATLSISTNDIASFKAFIHCKIYTRRTIVVSFI